MPHVILFEHANFHGQHKHVFGAEANLSAPDDNFFNDKVSSLIVIQNNWAFYRDANFKNEYRPILGPGLYPWVEAPGIDIKNDDMSSLQPVASQPTAQGLPIPGHVILFEHANFHGQHKHVFGAEANLNAPDDNFFNDKVSSLIVLAGTWAFYRDANFKNQYRPILGPGPYPWVEAPGIDIKNDDLSSLQPA